MNELIRVTQLPIIEEQLRSMKERVDIQVHDALSLICTEETLKTVKSVRADMNKQFAELEEQRKAVKAAVLGPYERFEAVYRECVSDLFKTADKELKDKINDVETEIKQRCEDGLREFFAELCVSERVDWLTYEQANVKVDMVSARQKTPRKLREQLADFVIGVSQSVNAIAAMEHADEIMVEFKKDLNVPQAISVVMDRHRRMEEEKVGAARRAEEARAEAEAVAKVEAAVPPTVQEPPRAPEQVYRCSFTVTTTKPKLVKLKEFLMKEGIRYE